MLLWSLLLNSTISLSVQIQQCTHPIFCNTEILDAVSNSSYFPDSKTFMDQILTVPIQKAIYMFKKVPLDKFLSDCFVNPDSVLMKTTLNDFKEVPETFAKITKPALRYFALELNKRWNQLARKVNLNFSTFSTCKQNCSTFLPEMDKKTIILPGGSFRQSYYWDTFLIIKGLIACDMLQTSQMLARNMMLMIYKYQFMPKIFRLKLYYLNRSQPPFFSLIIKQIVQAYRKKGLSSKADTYQKQCYDYMITEYSFWTSNRMTIFIISKQKYYFVFKYFNLPKSPDGSHINKMCKFLVVYHNCRKCIYISRSMLFQKVDGKILLRWLTNNTDIKVLLQKVQFRLIQMRFLLLQHNIYMIQPLNSKIQLYKIYKKFLKRKKHILILLKKIKDIQTFNTVIWIKIKIEICILLISILIYF